MTYGNAVSTSPRDRIFSFRWAVFFFFHSSPSLSLFSICDYDEYSSSDFLSRVRVCSDRFSSAVHTSLRDKKTQRDEGTPRNMNISVKVYRIPHFCLICLVCVAFSPVLFVFSCCFGVFRSTFPRFRSFVHLFSITPSSPPPPPIKFRVLLAGWFTFNDSRVTPTTEEAVKQAWGGRWSQTAAWQARRAAGVPPPAVAPKWGNSAANAYMLMYRRVDPAVNKRHLRRDEVRREGRWYPRGGAGEYS